MLPAVENGTLELTFTISEAQPPVAEEDVIWSFSPSPDFSELIVLNEDTDSRFNFSYKITYVRLTIHPVEQSDRGNYTVSVSNIAGEDSYTLFVDVVSKSNTASELLFIHLPHFFLLTCSNSLTSIQ